MYQFFIQKSSDEVINSRIEKLETVLLEKTEKLVEKLQKQIEELAKKIN